MMIRWAMAHRLLTLLALVGALGGQPACTSGRAAALAPKASQASQDASCAPSAGPGRVQSPQAHFAIIGDFGKSSLPEQQVADLVHSWRPEFIVTLGDNNYPNGSHETIDANIGQYYGAYIRPKAGAGSRYAQSERQRFFPCLGNHDWRAPAAQPYLDYFDLPGNGRYYQVVRGPVALFIVDSDPHEPDGVDAQSIQAQWLKGALAASKAPWKVVIFHHPPYSSGRHGSNTWMQWPFKAWGAHLVMGGHDHTYEHIIVDDLHYIVMGLSGASKDAFRIACALPRAQYDSCYDDNYGALEANASTTQFTLRMTTIDGRVHDTVTLCRPGAAPDGTTAAN